MGALNAHQVIAQHLCINGNLMYGVCAIDWRVTEVIIEDIACGSCHCVMHDSKSLSLNLETQSIEH